MVPSNRSPATGGNNKITVHKRTQRIPTEERDEPQGKSHRLSYGSQVEGGRKERGLVGSNFVGGARCRSLRDLEVLLDIIGIIDMFNVVVGLLDGINDDSSEGE